MSKERDAVLNDAALKDAALKDAVLEEKKPEDNSKMMKTYYIHINLKIEEMVCNGTLLFAEDQVIKNTKNLVTSN
jgi:hypothetical protein